MRILHQLLSKIEFNKFVFIGIVFLIWVSFFDKHNFINQSKLSNVISELEAEKIELEEKIKEAKNDKISLEVNKEKYAREKFHMHKENEEVYIIKK